MVSILFVHFYYSSDIEVQQLNFAIQNPACDLALMPRRAPQRLERCTQVLAVAFLYCVPMQIFSTLYFSIAESERLIFKINPHLQCTSINHD